MDQGLIEHVDALLIGAGIMSATVATLLKELDPSLRVVVFERLTRVAGESSDARNNAGTGHAALCELNYTPQRADGTIDTSKAEKIMECFEQSKQLWSYLVDKGMCASGSEFIRSIPHVSFVAGEDVSFLRARYEALQNNLLFRSMQFSESREQLACWMPLVMNGREADTPVAATFSELGTDVDFGALTRALFARLEAMDGFDLYLDHEVRQLAQDADGAWRVHVQDEELDAPLKYRANFVFIGAGGAAIDLLDASDIVEGQGYGGFPVSGLWLVCKNQDVIGRHNAKVYGKAKLGAPPMSVPHLDTRYIGGERALLFGPFAGFSTKFLKEGSYLDMPTSVTADNILPMLHAGIRNVPLTIYLIEQVLQSHEDRMNALREFVADASSDDWTLEVAGQRVQVIKKDDEVGGKLEFGTEIVSARDNTIAALLGASPGASTSVSVALDLLEDCFPERMKTERWRDKLREMIPSYGHKLAKDPALAERVRAHARRSLGLRA
ncbi:MAG: malate dehydrogenase (quinone) [Myxococcales bacterium]|nr:malate dehydrogenase (quinone) [Myxococcales bacterium]